MGRVFKLVGEGKEEMISLPFLLREVMGENILPLAWFTSYDFGLQVNADFSLIESFSSLIFSP